MGCHRSSTTSTNTPSATLRLFVTCAAAATSGGNIDICCPAPPPIQTPNASCDPPGHHNKVPSPGTGPTYATNHRATSAMPHTRRLGLHTFVVTPFWQVDRSGACQDAGGSAVSHHAHRKNSRSCDKTIEVKLTLLAAAFPSLAPLSKPLSLTPP